MCGRGPRPSHDSRQTLQIFYTENTDRYIDVLPNVIKAYNDTVHWTTGMAPSRVTASIVLAIWKRMEAAQGRVCVAKATNLTNQQRDVAKIVEQTSARRLSGSRK